MLSSVGINLSSLEKELDLYLAHDMEQIQNLDESRGPEHTNSVFAVYMRIS